METSDTNFKKCDMFKKVKNKIENFSRVRSSKKNPPKTPNTKNQTNHTTEIRKLINGFNRR